MSAPFPICVTLCALTLEQLREDLRALPEGLSLTEVRLDFLSEPPREVAQALGDLFRVAPTPILATCRPTREGGSFAGPEAERLELLRAASAAGAAWVDVEADSLDALDSLGPLPLSSRIVVSRHPEALSGAIPERRAEISALLVGLRDARASLTKLALPCADARDALTLLRLASQEPRPCLAIGMGFRGVATRLLGPSAGAPWSYAHAPSRRPAAPGQLSPEQLQGVSPEAQGWFGVLGAPLSHSRSPLLMNAAFGRLGLSAAYTWLETEDPSGLLREADLDPRWTGFSVTLPHKSALLERAELSPEAKAAGALNTLVRTPSGWRGYNTDALALEGLLRERVASGLKGLPVALLGNGGAARAAARVLTKAGAAVEVFARSEVRGRAFAAELGLSWGGSLGAVPLAAELPSPRVVLNATSVGMSPATDQTPVAAQVFGPGCLAYDLVYTPPRTRFLREAQARGAQTITGVDHFLAQARAQLELFCEACSGAAPHALPPLDDPWWLEAAGLGG